MTLHGGRDALVELSAVGFGHDVLAQRQPDFLRLRHRHDARGVDRAHLLDQLEDAVELGANFARFLARDLDPGEMRDALDVFG